MTSKAKLIFDSSFRPNSNNGFKPFDNSYPNLNNGLGIRDIINKAPIVPYMSPNFRIAFDKAMSEYVNEHVKH